MRHGQPDPAGAWPVVRPGFSIMEMVVVLFVVSLLAYVAVPAIEVVRFQVDGAARGAVAALVSAQRLAVKRQHDVIVTFDTVNRRLRIHEDRNRNGVVDTGESTRIVPFGDGVVFGRGQAPMMGEYAEVVTFTETQDGLPALRFIRNGSASEEGVFYLTSIRWNRDAQFVKDSRAVQVNRATGRVTWYRYDPPQWKEGL